MLTVLTVLTEDVKNTYFPSVAPPSDPEEGGRMTPNDSRYNAALSNNDSLKSS